MNFGPGLAVSIWAVPEGETWAVKSDWTGGLIIVDRDTSPLLSEEVVGLGVEIGCTTSPL